MLVAVMVLVVAFILGVTAEVVATFSSKGCGVIFDKGVDSFDVVSSTEAGVVFDGVMKLFVGLDIGMGQGFCVGVVQVDEANPCNILSALLMCCCWDESIYIRK